MALFWIGILVAVIFAYSAVKLGLYHTWTMLFNLLIGVYAAIYTEPVLKDFLPAAVGEQYSKALALIAISAGIFLILQGVAYVLLIGQFEVTFPRSVNIFGSGIMGFLAGFLVSSFAALIICTTPISQNQFVKEIGLETKTLKEAKMDSYLAWWCSVLNKAAASSNMKEGPHKTIEDLLIIPTKKTPVDANSKSVSIRQADINEPNRINSNRQEPENIIPP